MIGSLIRGDARLTEWGAICWSCPTPFLSGGLCGAAGIAVDGALLVTGGAVVFLLGDGGDVGGVIFGRHGYGAEEKTGEGGIPVEDVAALGVDVEEIECRRRGAGFFGEASFDASEKELENGGFEGVEEKGQGGGAWDVEAEGVLFVEAD